MDNKECRSKGAIENMNALQLREVLCDRNLPIGRRMRTVFFLRSANSIEAVHSLCACLILKGDSSLLRHEVGYCLGQMQNPIAIPFLEKVLRDIDDCPIVRHESAEALAAIGEYHLTINVLKEFCDDAKSEVSETCNIAVRQLEFLEKQKCEKPIPDVFFNSVDPTMPLTTSSDRDMNIESQNVAENNVKRLTVELLDQNLELFSRYRAMFALRNKGGDEAVLGLCKGFRDPSALFRHEIAFVLGQMSKPVSFNALRSSLEDAKEHIMVRHESAEAIGAIAASLDSDSVMPSLSDCVEVLKGYTKDSEQLVSESCITALDSIEYWQSFADPIAG